MDPRSSRGYTLVELLIVMLIIAVLAAIAVPAFFGERDKAHDAEAKSDLSTAQHAIETYATDNRGSYNGATMVDLANIEAVLSGTSVSVTAATDDAYTLESPSVSGSTFELRRSLAGSMERSCTPAGAGGCRGDGSW